MSKGIFVTATGTDVGKTYVTALIVKKLREAGYHAGYYKAALSGAEVTKEGLVPGDAAYVNDVAHLGEKPQELVSYVYEHAYSPHLAAQIEGGPVVLSQVINDFRKMAKKYEYLTVEGSGGIICPIRYDQEQIMLEDIIKACHLSTIIVADAGLGTINAVVLTVSYMRSKGIEIKGIIFNHYRAGDKMHEDNKQMVEEMTKIPVIACVEEHATYLKIKPDLLAQLYEEV